MFQLPFTPKEYSIMQYIKLPIEFFAAYLKIGTIKCKFAKLSHPEFQRNTQNNLLINTVQNLIYPTVFGEVSHIHEMVYGIHGEVHSGPYVKQALLCINMAENQNYPRIFSENHSRQILRKLSNGLGPDRQNRWTDMTSE
jgi:hypothetical protein